MKYFFVSFILALPLATGSSLAQHRVLDAGETVYATQTEGLFEQALSAAPANRIKTIERLRDKWRSRVRKVCRGDGTGDCLSEINDMRFALSSSMNDGSEHWDTIVAASKKFFDVVSQQYVKVQRISERKAVRAATRLELSKRLKACKRSEKLDVNIISGKPQFDSGRAMCVSEIYRELAGKLDEKIPMAGSISRQVRATGNNCFDMPRAIGWDYVVAEPQLLADGAEIQSLKEGLRVSLYSQGDNGHSCSFSGMFVPDGDGYRLKRKFAAYYAADVVDAGECRMRVSFTFGRIKIDNSDHDDCRWDCGARARLPSEILLLKSAQECKAVQ